MFASGQTIAYQLHTQGTLLRYAVFLHK